METKLFKNGQSMAVRLPAAWLKEGEFHSSVELEMKEGSIIIKPLNNHPREGWAEAAKKMNQLTEDKQWLDAGIEDGLEDIEW